jgi:hypothetical protein
MDAQTAGFIFQFRDMNPSRHIVVARINNDIVYARQYMLLLIGVDPDIEVYLEESLNIVLSI